MNAPEKINTLRAEIGQYLARVGEATAKDVADAVLHEKLAVVRALNEMLRDAEVEREKKRGNEYVYWLVADAKVPVSKAEKKPAVCESVQAAGVEQTDTPAATDAQRAEFTILQVIADIRAVIGDKEGRIMLGDLAQHIGELVTNAGHLDEQLTATTADVSRTRQALTNAINEADRLRAELAAERQAREAQQEQADAVDVKDAAIGYLVRATKRKARYLTQPERAREAALSAVRTGAAKAEVLAVVPVGTAHRGAEWRTGK